MPVKKKTNFISYELKKLDKYVKELMNYLDNNPSDQIEDRIELLETTRGQSIKVIASKEQQLNCYFDKLEKLPRLLEDINKLRMAVEGEEENEVRGGTNVPGFMSKKNTGQVYTKKNNNKIVLDSEEFPDDPDTEGTSQLGLPPVPEQEIEEVESEEFEEKIPEEEPEEEDPWDDEF